MGGESFPHRQGGSPILVMPVPIPVILEEPRGALRGAAPPVRVDKSGRLPARHID